MLLSLKVLVWVAALTGAHEQKIKPFKILNVKDLNIIIAANNYLLCKDMVE